MSRKKMILTALLMAFISGGWYGYSQFNRKVKDLDRVKAQVQTKATVLVERFENDQVNSNTNFLGKIIAVEGTVKTVEKNEEGFYTVVLGEQGSMSSVRCSMHASQCTPAAGLVMGSLVRIKGACTGFNSDELLGSDVILNRCVFD